MAWCWWRRQTARLGGSSLVLLPALISALQATALLHVYRVGHKGGDRVLFWTRVCKVMSLCALWWGNWGYLVYVHPVSQWMSLESMDLFWIFFFTFRVSVAKIKQVSYSTYIKLNKYKHVLCSFSINGILTAIITVAISYALLYYSEKLSKTKIPKLKPNDLLFLLLECQ